MTQPPTPPGGHHSPEEGSWGAPPSSGPWGDMPPPPGHPRPAGGAPPPSGEPRAPGGDGPPPGGYAVPGGAPSVGPGAYQGRPGEHQSGPRVPQDQPQWHQLPPEQLARMSQPGIIPLRPLTLGDIFTGALHTIRRNPEATIGMALMVLAIFMVPSLLLSLGLTRAASVAVEDQLVLSTGIQSLLQLLASTMLAGMIIFVVSEAVLGDKASLAQTWQNVRGRVPALIGNILLFTLIVVAVTIAAALVLGALVVGVGQSGSEGLMIALVIVGVLALLLGVLWLTIRFSLAPAPVVLEKLGPAAALGRSWRLTSGKQVWRVLGITLLAGILTSIIASMVQFPLLLGMEVAFGGLGINTAPSAPALMIGNHLIALLVDALVIPFSAGVTALLYLDQRIRREGLDVSLLRAAQDRAARRTR